MPSKNIGGNKNGRDSDRAGRGHPKGNGKDKDNGRKPNWRKVKVPPRPQDGNGRTGEDTREGIGRKPTGRKYKIPPPPERAKTTVPAGKSNDEAATPIIKPTMTRSCRGVDTPLYYVKGSPNYLLSFDVQILRDLDRGCEEKADLRQGLPKDVDLDDRLKRMKKDGWIKYNKNDGKPNSPFFTGWVLTRTGWDILKTTKGFEFGSKELRVLTDGINACLAADRATGELVGATREILKEMRLSICKSKRDAGGLLDQALALIPHGWQGVWVRENFGMRSVRTAQRYIEYSKTTLTTQTDVGLALQEELAKLRKIWGNKTAEEEQTPVERDGAQTKRKTKSRNNDADVVVLTVRVPVGARNRWDQIIEFAKKRFDEGTNPQATMRMAEDWMDRVSKDTTTDA
jgi:hypothetical protein